jgi:hypothetical protein
LSSLLLSLACVPARGGGFLDQVGNALGAVQNSTESTMHAVGEQASSLEKQAEGLGSSISSQVAPALASAQNSTMSAIDGMKHCSETAVVKALLWASGKCPELWKLLPGAPAQLAQKLSEAFASTEESPSASKASCRTAVQAGLEGIVDGEMGDASDQEKFAVKISLQELTGKVCTDDLMEALETMEEIRRGHREQYRMAIGDRLLLRVLTEDALREELAGYCGDDGADAAEVSGLFAERPAVGAGTSAPLGPVALLAAAAVLLTASVVAVRRCSCSVARLLLGRDVVDEAERGLVDCVE